MSHARLLLVALICASPAVLLFDGPIARALVAGVTAIGLFILLRTMRPGETSFFLSTMRTVAFFAAIPAIWMLVQVIPLGVLTNPFGIALRRLLDILFRERSVLILARA